MRAAAHTNRNNPAAMHPTELTQTAKTAAVISSAALSGAVIGFLLQLIVAYHFGASAQTDAYFMASSTSELLSKLLLGGSITAVFLPIFVEKLLHDRAAAWSAALNIFHLTAAVFTAVIIGLALAARPFVTFIAPGFSPETATLTVTLLRILLPSFLFLFLGELATSILHALRIFWAPALLRLIAPTITIFTLLLLLQRFGIGALALGTVASAIVQFSFLAWNLRRAGLTYRFVFSPGDPTIRRILQLVYPFALSVLVTQGAGIVYRILVSDLSSGSLAALKFAEKITQLLALMFLNSVIAVIFPTLSHKAAARDFRGMRDTISGAVKLITFITVPVIAGAVLLHHELISVLYQRGSFSAEDAAMTSSALLFLVLGLTTNGISSIFGHAVLALQETRASVAVSIASQAIAISLFILLTPPLAHAGLALASSLAPLAAALLYFLYLTRFIPQLYRVFASATLLKTAGATAIMAAIVSTLQRTVYRLNPPAAAASVLALTIPLGAAVFFALAYWWHIPEVRDVAALARKKWSSFRHR